MTAASLPAGVPRRGRRHQRPVLLVLVYGAFLALVGITASAQAMLVSEHLSTTALNSIVASDAATVRTFVNGGSLLPSDLRPGGLESERLASLEKQLAGLVARGEILRAELRAPDGTVLVGDLPSLTGMGSEPDAAFQAAAGGTAQAALVGQQESTGAVGPALGTSDVLREYLPLVADGKTQAVFAIWRDAAPILRELDESRRDVVGVTLVAALVLAALLFFIFRSTQRRLSTQTAELIEATRRDAQTGMLNHAALVEHLGAALEQARAARTEIAVALVDIDNFRALNETHGHDAGDQALEAVAALLPATMPDGAIAGRYGPDEFLVIAGGAGTAALRDGIERLRAALAATTLHIGVADRLPLTVSAGICEYPRDARSVTPLLTAAAVAVGEAKTSGGDAVRLAGEIPAGLSDGGSFDVLKGLVLAVDTKDHYTKRHSEDVARYAVFLGRELGLDGETMRGLHVAGLLHDVGKIGIPDAVLRKPGKLTAQEYAIVQQHVALGDMVVRDLRDIDLVRAGVRHYHERWDGAGYLDGLAAEQIPLVARILSIGDAFSAMTTSRPYRKALDIREALTRLEDAAGSQLDARLVTAFVSGIETAADAPLPGDDRASAHLWLPERLVA